MTDNPLKVQETIGSQLMSILFENITTLRTPWSITPEQMQSEILDRMRKGIDVAVQRMVKELLSAGAVTIVAQLKSIQATDSIKATLICGTEVEALHSLIDRRGSTVMILLIDPKQYTEGMEQFKAMSDQMPLISDET